MKTTLAAVSLAAVLLWVHGVSTQQARWNARYDRCEAQFLRHDPTTDPHTIADWCSDVTDAEMDAADVGYQQEQTARRRK
jgi:hypothetical protein